MSSSDPVRRQGEAGQGRERGRDQNSQSATPSNSGQPSADIPPQKASLRSRITDKETSSAPLPLAPSSYRSDVPRRDDDRDSRKRTVSGMTSYTKTAKPKYSQCVQTATKRFWTTFHQEMQGSPSSDRKSVATATRLVRIRTHWQENFFPLTPLRPTRAGDARIECTISIHGIVIIQNIARTPTSYC
jgi:hypothetical protein